MSPLCVFEGVDSKEKHRQRVAVGACYWSLLAFASVTLAVVQEWGLGCCGVFPAIRLGPANGKLGAGRVLKGIFVGAGFKLAKRQRLAPACPGAGGRRE